MIEATIRSFSGTSRGLAHERLNRVAQHVAAAHRADADVSINPGVPVTVCDECAVDLVGRVAGELFGEAAWRKFALPVMGAEDFA
ncbi:hypothetical protein [Bradyrhizobium sp. JR3.5]